MPRRARHLVPFLLLLTALLYGARPTLATESFEGRAPAVADPVQGPHVALLLPTGSESFARAAEAVHAGFLEASRRHTAFALPARLYPVTEDPKGVVSAYRKALAAGARMVVGPLTRNGVTALARAPDLVTVPTLVLNVPEHAGTPAGRLFSLNLQIEAEARQVAQLALGEGRRKAFTVSEPSPLAKRMREAFIAEFERGGGHHIAEYAYSTDPAALERMKQAAALKVADMVFFALDAARIAPVRAAMAPITGYGTSQINPGSAGYPADMHDVRFVDMPWMVQPDHPAVMVYARRAERESDDLERLYALGIDARRVAEDLLAGKQQIELDGVTGRLQLGPGGNFRRGLLVMLVDGGRLTVLGESRP